MAMMSRRVTVVERESKEERYEREMAGLLKSLGREVRTRLHSKTGTLAELEMTHPEWFVPETERIKGEVEEEVDWMTNHRGSSVTRGITLIGMKGHVTGEGWWNEGDLPPEVVKRTVQKKVSAQEKMESEFLDRIDAEEKEKAKLNPARIMARAPPPAQPRTTLVDRAEQGAKNPLNARLRSAAFPKDFLKLSAKRVSMCRGGSTVDEATRQICPEERLPELNASHVVRGRASPASSASTPGLLSRSSSRMSQRSASSATPSSASSRMSDTRGLSSATPSRAGSPAYSDGGSTPGTYSTPGGWSMGSGYTANGAAGEDNPESVLHLRRPRRLTASPSPGPKKSPPSARQSTTPATSNKVAFPRSRWGAAKELAKQRLEEEAETRALAEKVHQKKVHLAARPPDQVVGEAFADFRETKHRMSTELKDKLLRREVFVETAGPGLRGTVTHEIEDRLRSNSTYTGKDVQRLSKRRSAMELMEHRSKSADVRDVERKYAALCDFVEGNPDEHWCDPDEVAVMEACKGLLESGTGFTEHLFAGLIADECLARKDGSKPLEEKPRLCMLVHQIRFLCGVDELSDARLMAEEVGTALPVTVEHIDPNADEHRGAYADILRLIKQFPNMAQGLKWITAASAVFKMATRSDSHNKINGVRLEFLKNL